MIQSNYIKEINVIPEIGDEYIVRISIPASIQKGSDEEWNYICAWIDKNLDGIKEWEE